MKRNFVGYFQQSYGYVFLCIFVFLTSLAAFWPYEFFNQNLATLDQLNYWFPLIMLVFIPAITMSIWAEEKRQGTDELLLTLPADDFDIVIGKYMAAASIFTASLLFSQLSTFITLAILTEGALDTGLIFTTYLGYWFVGPDDDSDRHDRFVLDRQLDRRFHPWIAIQRTACVCVTFEINHPLSLDRQRADRVGNRPTIR